MGAASDWVDGVPIEWEWTEAVMRAPAALVAVVLAAGCATTTADVTADHLDEAGVEVGSTWMLESGRVGGEELQPLADHPITFSRTPDGVEGQSSCNTYAETGSDADQAEEDVAFPGLAATARLCLVPDDESSDEQVMDLEEQFLTVLWAATDVHRDGDRLVVAGPSGELTFRAAPG